MKYRNRIWQASIAGLIATSLSVQAQTDDLDEEDVFELSPFTVTAAEDEGYRSTTTLAGTRLKTQLKDIGSAISVLTEEFFEDTGATDAQSVLSYALNMEVGGDQGNYAGGTNQNDQRTNPQNRQRVRGLGAASLTRNYFLTSIPFETYNTDRVTINRGPNSLLFGIGTPSGVIENSVARASVNKDFGDASVRVGERGSTRLALDVNKTLIEGRLGMRAAVLSKKTKFKQEPAYEDDERIYLSATGVLRQGGDSFLGKTTLRGNLETGEIVSNRPDVTPPINNIEHWFEMPPNYTAGDFVPKITVNNLLGEQGGAIPGPQGIPFFVQIALGIPEPVIDSFGGVSARDSGIEAIQGRYYWNGNHLDENGVKIKRRDFFASSYQNQGVGYSAPSLSYDVWDNNNRLISGNENQVIQEFQAWNLTLEQELFGGKGGIEVSIDEQDYDTDRFLGFTENPIRIDINEYWGNGDANPNVGRPFFETDVIRSTNQNYQQREAFRTTAFYELDMTENDSWARHLGRHIFTGFYSDQTVASNSTAYKFAWDSPDVDLDYIIGNKLGQWRRNVNGVVYLGDSLLGDQYQSSRDVLLTQSLSVPDVQDGDTFRTVYWDRADGQSKEADLIARQVLSGGGISKQTVTSEVISLQSYLFGGNVVGLLGYRDDTSTKWERIAVGDTPNGAYTLDDRTHDPSTIILGEDPTLVFGDSTLTKSLVGHLPSSWNPFSDHVEVSAHWSESENFQPSAARRNIIGESLAPPSGETTEYGLTFQLLDNNLSVRMNWYDTLSTGASLSTGALGAVTSWGSTSYMNRWNEARNTGMSFEDAYAFSLGGLPEGEADPGYTSYEEIIEAFRTLLPEPTRSLINARFEDTALVTDTILSRSTTTDRSAEGFEIDIVGNLTKNWRLSLNFGKQETVQANSAPVLQQVVAEVTQNIRDAGLWYLYDSPNIGETRTLGSRFSSNVASPMAAALANDGTVSTEQRKYRANLATNYKFGNDSMLKGFAIGGGLRYQDKVAIGYPLQDDDGDGIFLPVLDTPIWGPDNVSGDLWLSYNRKLQDGKRWKVQINARNAFGDHDIIPYDANPDGTVSRYRNPNSREVFITNTLTF